MSGREIVPSSRTVSLVDADGEVVQKELDESSFALWKLYEGYRTTYQDLQASKAQISYELSQRFEHFDTTFRSLSREWLEGGAINDQRWQALSAEANAFGLTVQHELNETHRKFGVVEQAYIKDRKRFSNLETNLRELNKGMEATHEFMRGMWKESRNGMQTLITTLRGDIGNAFEEVESRFREHHNRYDEIAEIVQGIQDRRPDIIPTALPVDFHTYRSIRAGESSATTRSRTRRSGSKSTTTRPRPTSSLSFTKLMSGLNSLKVRKIPKTSKPKSVPTLPPDFTKGKEPAEREELNSGSESEEGLIQRLAGATELPSAPGTSLAATDDEGPRSILDSDTDSDSDEAWLSPSPPPQPPVPTIKRKRQEADDGNGGIRPPHKKVAMEPSDPSSNSSSSEDSDLDPSGDDWSLDSRRQRFLTKRHIKQQAYERALRELRSKKRAEPKLEIVRMKKPDPIKPERYDGSRYKWASWWSTMVDYLEQTRLVLTSDVERIRMVGSFLTGQARHWYDCRKRRLEKVKGRGADSYPLFVEEMKKQFSDPQLKVSAVRKMQNLKYDPRKGIATYLIDLADSNLDVEMAGVALISLLRQQVPFEIWSRIPNESIIEDHEEYMYHLRNQGVSYENSLEAYKAIHGRYPGESKAPQGQKEKDQGKKIKGTAPKPEDLPEAKSKLTTAKADRKVKAERKDPKVWLKDLSRESQNKRIAKGHCGRCNAGPGKEGKPPHSVWNCTGELRLDTSANPKASAANKRKRGDGDEGNAPKKQDTSEPKVSAVGAHPRISELDSSDDEEGFSYATI